jgi:hypothetical protein
LGEIISGQDQVDFRTGELLHLAKTFVAVMILLGILAPVMMTSFGYVGNYDLTIVSLFWYFEVGTFGSGWLFLPPYATISMLPYLALRMVPVYMTYRYYQGKTTRRRAAAGILIGDLLFLIGTLPEMILAAMFAISYLIFPLPVQMLVGFFILRRYPIPEPTKPWEGSEETKPWWENESSSLPKSPEAKNEEDRLW